MRNSKVPFVLLAVALFLAGCAIHLGTLPVAGSKQIELSMQEFEKVAEEVTGSSYRHIVIMFENSKPAIDEAVRDALEKSGGDIMTDVEIYLIFWHIPFLYGRESIEVKGDVWRLKGTSVDMAEPQQSGKVDIEAGGTK